MDEKLEGVNILMKTNKVLLTFSIQINHADGLHIDKYLSELQKHINNL